MEGIAAVLADDGLVGLRVLLDELLTLDVLVTELLIPSLSGESLVGTIRKLGGERDLPIVVVSGALDAARVARLLAAGADAVVEKQGGPEAVVEEVVRLLSERGWRPACAPAAVPARPVARIALQKARPA